MADRLSIYRASLLLLGGANISSLSEDRPEKRALDAVWTDGVNYMLEQGMWNFAIRSIELAYDEDVEPLFGYRHAFSKPEDWVRTVSISETADFREGLHSYEDETTNWHADPDYLYIRYVSNDEAYGWNVGAWRQTFSKALSAYLAFESGLAISADRGNRNDLYSLYKTRLADAKIKDAVDERVREKPPGRWTRSRNAYPMRDRRG